MKFSLTSPSKLNLRLEVTGRKDDGYHLLRMINVECGLSDEIEIEILKGDPKKSEISVSFDVKDEDETASWCSDLSQNIAGKAAVLYLEKFALSYRARIAIKKAIPTGSGLGGGSSNGATVLRGISQALGTTAMENGFSLDKYSGVLRRIAEVLGADVPYFLTGGAALVEGIGEKVTPLNLPFLDKERVHLIIPPGRINTATLYEKFRRDTQTIVHREPLFTAEIASAASLIEAVKNDLEPSIVSLAPTVGEILKLLRLRGETASVTGSGSACFVLFPRLATSETQELLSHLGARVVPSELKTRHNPLIQLN